MANYNLKTWVEIKSGALKHNIGVFKKLLKPKVKMWAVVKSNAYGHGLIDFSKAAARHGVDGFCVDSVIEGVKLRQAGIRQSILVLGPSLPHLLPPAAKNKITVTISTFEGLKALAATRAKPEFHLKIDTGMHRQGFFVENIPPLVKKLASYKLKSYLTGAYTHFSSAKDLNYPTFTDLQFHAFQRAAMMLAAAGFNKLLKHAAATGGALINEEYQLDAVRLGIGLYGLWPSKELEIQRPDIKLEPVLSWHALVSEVKNIQKYGYVGYDLVERVYRPTKMAVIPIGYWHGFPRALSSVGEVLIRGRRARVLGRVSMDLIVVDVTGIPCRVGDKATIIGSQGQETITAQAVSQKYGTTHYETVTRINPLIERIIT